METNLASYYYYAYHYGINVTGEITTYMMLTVAQIAVETENCPPAAETTLHWGFIMPYLIDNVV